MTIQYNHSNSSKTSLEQLLAKLETMRPLKYEAETNALFSSLQEKVSHFDAFDRQTAQRLNRLWAERGFSVEYHFAQNRKLREFDFYEKYKKLTAFESRILKHFTGKRHYEKIYFVGCDPLPLTLNMLRIDIPKVGIDYKKEALTAAKKALPRDRFGRKIEYRLGDFFNLKLEEKKPVIVYIAGLILGKERGMERIIKQLPEGSLLIIRTVAEDKRQLFYERIERSPFRRYGKVKEFNPPLSSGIVNGMLIIDIANHNRKRKI
jgi:SAM-dependent methyltransferase